MTEVLSVGARGPLGLSSLQLALCLRAARMEPHSLAMHDKRGHEIGMCITGGLGATLYGYQRLVALAAPAIREAVRGAELLSAEGPPLPFVLCLPEPGRPDDDPKLDQADGEGIVQELARRSAVALDADNATIIRAGHAGGALALEAAQQLLSAGAEHVVVGGVDSYYHPDVLRWLDEEYRLHALDAEDGIVPSEGAAFAVLSAKRSRRASPHDNHAAVRVRLIEVATATEDSLARNEPNTAEAMTDLIAGMKASLGDPAWVLSDVNGERHRIREWSMVDIRQLGNDVTQQRFANQLGDIGAAVGPTLLAVACQQFERGVAPAQRVVVALHSEGAQRGVFALQAVSS